MSWMGLFRRHEIWHLCGAPEILRASPIAWSPSYWLSKRFCTRQGQKSFFSEAFRRPILATRNLQSGLFIGRTLIHLLLLNWVLHGVQEGNDLFNYRVEFANLDLERRNPVLCPLGTCCCLVLITLSFGFHACELLQGECHFSTGNTDDRATATGWDRWI